MEEFMMDTIAKEMTRGNFSFLILVVGLAQLFVMIGGRIMNKHDDTEQAYINGIKDFVKKLKWKLGVKHFDLVDNLAKEMGVKDNDKSTEI